MSELNTVLSQLFDKNTVTVPSLNKEVAIKKVTLRTMKRVTALIAKVFEDLKLTADNLPSVNITDPSLVLKLISKYYDEVIEIVLDHSSIERDELLDIDPDESALVVQAVIALNKDFFTKKVLPNLGMFDQSPQS